MHCFPNPEKDVERFRSWVMNIGGEIIGRDNDYIFKNRRVCHKHFPEKWHYPKNRLSSIAVPTLNVAGKEHKPFCATHDQYTKKSESLLNGVGLPPSPTPQEEQVEIPTWPLAHEADPLAEDEEGLQNLKKVDVSCLSESICAKPISGTDDDNAELHLLDLLDPELLTDRFEPDLYAIGHDIYKIDCHAWPPVLASGLASEAKQSIIGRYPRPSNCGLLQTPTMNPKIVKMVPEKIIANDDKWFKMQLCVGTAITAISRAMEMLMLGQSREKALRHLTNSCLILCDLHYTHTKIRKINVIPFVDDTTKTVIEDCRRDHTLFGRDFFKKWKAAKKLEPKPKKVRKKVAKSVKLKKKASSSGPSLVAYSGQWHPPLRVVRNRRSMAGARRPPAGAAPQPPAHRRRGQPRPPGSPGGGVMRNWTIQLKQIERNDAFGNEITSTPPDIEESHSYMQTDMEDRCVQGEVTDDVSKQSSITYNRNTSVERTNYGAGTKFTVMNRTKQIEIHDAWGNKIKSTPADIETRHPHMHTEMEDRYNQEAPAVNHFHQSSNISIRKNSVKRKRRSDGTNPLKKLTSNLSKQTEQYDAFGNRKTSTPTSKPQMQTKLEDATVKHKDPLILRFHSHAHHGQPTIHYKYYNQNKTVIVKRCAKPLVLPPQMPSRDMPTLHSNDEPPD